jgi:hypothetical protein
MAREKSKPKTRELAVLYRGLATSSLPHRIEVLKKVLCWYDEALEYLKPRMKEDGIDRLGQTMQLVRLRRMSLESGDLLERQAYLVDAIQWAEKLCESLHPCSVHAAILKASLHASEQFRDESRLGQKYARVLTLLSEGLRPESVDGKPMLLRVANAEIPRVYSTAGNELVYSQKQMRVCRSILYEQGPLALALHEVKALSSAFAGEWDGGRYRINSAKQLSAVYKMMGNFVEYCKRKDAPRQLVRRTRC